MNPLLDAISTPSYIINEDRLLENFKRMQALEKATGVHALVAIKSFAMPVLASFIPYVSGVAASGPWEAKFAHNKLRHSQNKPFYLHTFCGAYSNYDVIDCINSGASHMVFNSINQLLTLGSTVSAIGNGEVELGLRCKVNLSVVKNPLYDPSHPRSRFGITGDEIDQTLFKLSGLSGLHYHNLCESPAEDFVSSLDKFRKDFGHILPLCSWVNLGGGQLFTNDNFCVDKAIAALLDFKEEYPNLSVFVEPGCAFFENAGQLATTILDIFHSDGKRHIIVDASATCHMPDILEAPYTPKIQGTSILDLNQHQTESNQYLIGSQSCLTGDVIGQYAFQSPPEVGDLLIIEDQLHYSFAKQTHFNGVKTPAVYLNQPHLGRIECIQSHGYSEYESKHDDQSKWYLRSIDHAYT